MPMHVYGYQVVAKIPMASHGDCVRLVQCLRGVYNTDSFVSCNSLSTHSFAIFMRSCKRAMNMAGPSSCIFEVYMPDDVKIQYGHGYVTVSRITYSIVETDADEDSHNCTRKRVEFESE